MDKFTIKILLLITTFLIDILIHYQIQIKTLPNSNEYSFKMKLMINKK